jgi:hypothetical protein
LLFGWWLPTSLPRITHCHISTLLCRRRHHDSEVQKLFSIHSLSDVSWGKVRSMTEWRNTPGRPGCDGIRDYLYFNPNCVFASWATWALLSGLPLLRIRQLEFGSS